MMILFLMLAGASLWGQVSTSISMSTGTGNTQELRNCTNTNLIPLPCIPPNLCRAQSGNPIAYGGSCFSGTKLMLRTQNAALQNFCNLYHLVPTGSNDEIVFGLASLGYLSQYNQYLSMQLDVEHVAGIAKMEFFLVPNTAILCYNTWHEYDSGVKLIKTENFSSSSDNRTVVLNYPLALSGLLRDRLWVRVSSSSNGIVAIGNINTTIGANVASIGSTNNAIVCAGQSATLSANMNTSGNTYLWSNSATTQSIAVSPLQTTTYTVTITDASGGQQFASKQVIVNPAPTVTLTSSAPTICAGSTTTVRALASGAPSPFSYRWSNQTAATATAITTISAVGTYTVTTTAAAGCTSTKSVTITTAPTPNLILAFSTTPDGLGDVVTYCASDGSGIHLVATADAANATFLWSTTATAPVIFTNPRGAATYTVTVTSPAGCTTTRSITIGNGCCSGLIGYRYENQNTSQITDFPNSIPNPSGNSFPRQQVLIVGTLTIDKDLDIYNVYIYMCEGAKIVVKNGHRFQISANDDPVLGFAGIRGMGKMWNTILVETGGTLLLSGYYIGGSPTSPVKYIPLIIEDAYQAVSLQPGSIFSANVTYFQNNHTAITTVRSSTREVYNNIYIRNCRFTSNRNLKPSFAGQGAVSTNAYAGIVLNDAQHSGTEGLTDHFQNGSTFSNLRYGIQLWNSEARVKYSKFSNINAFTSFGVINPSPEVYDGTAITARNNSKLTMSRDAGTAFSGTYGIGNCRNGVMIMQSDADISEHPIGGCTNGIGVRLCKNNTVNIQRCAISRISNIGIHFYANSGGTYTVGAAANETNFLGNEITSEGIPNTPNTTAGIRIDGTNDANCRYIINRNTIDNCRSAISLNSSRPALGSAVSHNIINMDGANTTGIAITNCNSFALETNTIAGSGVAQANTIGINLNASNVKLCQNTTTQTNVGMRFQANCGNTALSGNTIGSHSRGIEYSPTLTMQAQQDLGNTFAGTYSNVGAYNGNVKYIDPNNPNLGYIVPGQIHTNQVGQLWTSQNTNLPTVQTWFEDTNPNTNPPQICPLVVPRPAAYEEAIAEGTVTTNEYPTEMQWWTKKDLYEDMVAGRNTTQSTILQDFKDSLANTTLGNLTDIKQSSTDLFKPSETLRLQIEHYKQQISTLEAQLNAISNAIYADSTNSNPSLRTEADNIKTLLVSNYTAFEQIMSTWKAQTDNEADDLKAQNDLVLPTLLQEIQQKIVNDVYFSTLAKGEEELTEVQANTLRFIANQCPYTGGSAVFEARSLLAGIDTTLYDDKDLCAAQGINYRIKPKNASHHEETNSAFSFYPNPAKNVTTLGSANTAQITGQLAFIDMLGRTVYTQPYNGVAQQHIGLDALNSGIYFVRLLCNDGNILNIGQLNVIK